VQFNYALLTRSQRISHENLRTRDPKWLADAETWFHESCGGQGQRAPMFTPFTLRDLRLTNRVVVSPMAQYKAADGIANDWHLVHYGERAKGGAGLVMTEMICVSPQGRITPGCAGLYTDAQANAWRRIVDFVHAQTHACIAAQIGHSGRKGSTQVGWENMDAPLPRCNWSLLSASPLPWSDHNAVPSAMSRADMDMVTAQFVSAAQRAAAADFDMLEVHAAHGYLLASFLSPLTNIRTDDYGGSLVNRLRYPIEVVTAVRSVWPAHKPLSVRISANDWVGAAGMLPHDAVDVAKALQRAGADICNVSAGQTDPTAQPTYGRMFQTPFSDQIRNESGMPTMTAGNIYTVDHVNSIVIAGRADLVSLGRPHLANPYWTLHAAATLGHSQTPWPQPYLAGGEQLTRLSERNEKSEQRV
jgi:anthraniloyl-CoA monooxygenase